ncbi:hypothetical protein [Paenibacillus sp. MBLB4367]|uniref:hypothetical protein n=1 Tax=Paenibacillus sp. MBLB4367 TaxID=3384767 RepID=UPI00390807AD
MVPRCGSRQVVVLAGATNGSFAPQLRSGSRQVVVLAGTANGSFAARLRCCSRQVVALEGATNGSFAAWCRDAVLGRLWWGRSRRVADSSMGRKW